MAAGEALDTFHRKVALTVREDFDILVIDPDTGQEIFEAADYVEGEERGTVEFLGEDLTAVQATRSGLKER